MSEIQIDLLGEFRICTQGKAQQLPHDAQRLVAFLALQQRALIREEIAGVVWGECSQDRANGNLRTALWRTRLVVPMVITVPEPQHLSIAPQAGIDVSRLKLRGWRAVSGAPACRDDDLDAAVFRSELLPGWYDDWVIVEREHLRQLRLHALEAVSIELLARGRFAEALEAGMTAIDLDPMRESAHRCVIRVHLAEGNQSEALGHFEEYRSMLGREVGVTPTDQLGALLCEVGSLRDARDTAETPQ